MLCYFRGTEFLGTCLVIYHKFNVTHQMTNDSGQKSAIVENMIRTIKTRLFRVMDSESSLVWFDKLDDVKLALNKKTHRILGITPNAAETHSAFEIFYKNTLPAELRNLRKTGKQKHGFYRYGVGTLVRIQRESSYQKGFYGQWTSQLYRIIDRKLKSFLPVYYLENAFTGDKIIGSFGEEEIKKVNVNEAKLPKVLNVFKKRIDNNREQVQVELQDVPGRRWMDVDSLIQYD